MADTPKRRRADWQGLMPSELKFECVLRGISAKWGEILREALSHLYYYYYYYCEQGGHFIVNSVSARVLLHLIMAVGPRSKYFLLGVILLVFIVRLSFFLFFFYHRLSSFNGCGASREGKTKRMIFKMFIYASRNKKIRKGLMEF